MLKTIDIIAVVSISPVKIHDMVVDSIIMMERKIAVFTSDRFLLSIKCAHHYCNHKTPSLNLDLNIFKMFRQYFAVV